jgi:hypothetical protein
MQNNLVGQTVRFSPQDKKEGGNKTRTLYIHSETWIDDVRYYVVQDTETKEGFHANADKYDEFFLVNKSRVAPKNHREAIQNKSQIDYQKSN